MKRNRTLSPPPSCSGELLSSPEVLSGNQLTSEEDSFQFSPLSSSAEALFNGIKLTNPPSPPPKAVVSFTTSDYEPAVDKGIFTSTPKPKQELYTDFFPLELEVLPSPVHSPSPVNLSPSPPTHLPPPSSKLLPVQLSPTSPLQSNRLFSERRKLNRARISNRYMWIPELGLRKFDKYKVKQVGLKGN